MSEKYCTKCKQNKPTYQFSKHNRTKDGLQFWCKACRSEYDSEHKERHNYLLRIANERVKRECLERYGDGQAVCVRCGFRDIRALSIDHIRGRGGEERAKLNLGGKPFYYWLKRQGFPKGYQTLCMNCQFIKRQENREYGG